MSAAVDTLRATLTAAPDSWLARLALIEVLLAQNQSEEAAAVLGGVTELPADPESQVHAARAYGLFDAANGLEILAPILAANPTHAPAHFQYAFLCHRAGDTANALKHYVTATTLEPGLADHSLAAELTGTAPGVIPDSSPPTATDRSNVVYPAPGDFPLRTLREALGVPPMEPLVDPNSIPQVAALDYVEEPDYRQLVYTPEEAVLEEVQNVQVHPRTDERVVYDYQEPDDSIFEHDRTPDTIYVGALVTEEGLPVANLQQTLQNRKQERDKKAASARRRDHTMSLFIGLGFVAGAMFLMTLIAISVRQARPPVIVASVIGPINDSNLETRQIEKPKVQPNPVAAAAASAQLDLLSARVASPVAMPNIETPGLDPGLAGVGLDFGSSMSFGPAGGAGTSMFFGSKTKGNLAVIFDITASMYSANPLVVKEINKDFKEAQVVVVFGATFKDMPDAKLERYKKNELVLRQVQLNGKGRPAVRDAMNEALFSLRNCDSLESKSGAVQSLGRALELLLNQPSTRRPKTIFIFSDFLDGVDPNYLEKVQDLVKRRGAKVVFYHPVKFARDKATYEAFAKATRGEVKEGL